MASAARRPTGLTRFGGTTVPRARPGSVVAARSRCLSARRDLWAASWEPRTLQWQKGASGKGMKAYNGLLRKGGKRNDELSG